MAYSPDLTIKDARDLYLTAHGFSVGDYGAATFTIRIAGINFRFPNTPARKRAIPLHDLHHILTGYETDWTGEAEIGAWEVRAGCNSFITYFLNGSAALIGLFIAPRRVWRAFQKARSQRTLHVCSIPYERILQMTVGEVRKLLAIPAQGLAG